MDAAKRDRDLALAAKARADERIKRAEDFSPEKLVAFGNFLRDVFANGETPFRKAYACMFVDRIDVSRNKAIIRVKRDAVHRSIDAVEGSLVPISVQEWRTPPDGSGHLLLEVAL